MTQLDVVKGQNVALTVDDEPVVTVRLSVAWLPTQGLDVDVSALLLDDSGRVRGDRDFVFYNQPEAEGGAVRLLGKTETEGSASDRLLVSLDDVPAEVSTVVVLVSLDAPDGAGFGLVQDLAVTVATADERPLVRFVVPDLGSETAVLVGELYRRHSAWRFRAIGQGYAAGLAGVATDFGIVVSDTEDGQDPGTPLGLLAQGDIPLTLSAGDADDGVDPVQLAEPLVEAKASKIAQVALPMSPALAARAESRSASVRTRKQPPVVSRVRPLTLGDDPSWRAARLFPIVGIGGADEQERRATSALLAVLMGVKEFGRAITVRLGAPAGPLETYLEVPFSKGEATVIPDGVLRVARAGRVWTALLEVKTSSTLLFRPQVESYIDVARERGYDAVVTISNELPAAPGEHPVGIDRRKLRKVTLHHLAWAEVVHEGTMQLAHRGVADPTQEWVLSELLRYLRHPRSGASGFEDMGSGWVSVRESIAAGTLRTSDRKAPQVAKSWDQLIRQVCLRKTAELGVDVTPVGVRRHAADPAARVTALVTTMVDGGVLIAGLRMPGAVSPVMVTALVRIGQVEVSVELPAPTVGRPLTRVNWLLRQLAKAPEGLRIDVTGVRPGDGRSELVKAARADPKLLTLPNDEIRLFQLSFAGPLGPKRSIGRGGFITSVHEAVDTFYREVLQDLRSWSSPPPKLPAHDAAAGEDQPEADDDDAASGT